MKKVTHFLDYAASHPDAIITYNASNVVLVGHSDASYLSEKITQQIWWKFLHV